MSDPFFCYLYIDTDESIDSLERAFAGFTTAAFGEIAVENLIYRNENFDLGARVRFPYDFIECSRYYVELAALDEVPDQLSDFQSGVAVLVGNLRDAGRFVTVSCDFEDAIAEATGWNWSESTPEPPGRNMSV